MQLNFTYLPKTGQHSKHMVASQTSWLKFIIRVLNVFDPVCKFFEIYACTWKLTDISLFVAFLVLAKSTITPDFRLDVITSFGSYEWAHYWRHDGEL